VTGVQTCALPISWDPILADYRKEYHENYQPILESDPKYRELVEKFWFHMTNSANSDGRWPPPPAETCPFNRQWVLDEIAATRKTLDTIKETVKGIPLPEPAEETPRETWKYGYHYTDKDPENIRKLNYYELSHALYEFFRMHDEGEGEIKEKGRRMVNAVFEEFERRGGERSEHRRI